MKNFTWVLLIAFAVFSFSSCGNDGYRANSNSGNKNAGNTNAAAKPEKDLKATAKDLEMKAYEAWQKKDGKFFEGFLTEGFVGNGANGRNTMAGVAKAISDNPCEIKGFTIEDEQATELADGVVLFTAKTTSDVTCEGKASPSPLHAATVYVKDGDDWKAAFHQNAPTAETKGEAPAPPADAPKVELPKGADEEVAKAITETEKGLWEAWVKKDTKAFEESLADNFTGFNPGGREDRAAALKNIGEHKCDVKTHSLSDFHTAKLADNLYLLTYKAAADGTCDGKPLPKGFWVSTIASKDGDKWKGHFHMSTPTG